MALHFNAHQFDREFEAQRLCNWQVPKIYRDNPRIRTGYTKIIANNSGHLLPGIRRPPKSNAWGHFTPTWRMPNKITLKTAEDLRYPKTLFKPNPAKHRCEREEKDEVKIETDRNENQDELTCPEEIKCPDQITETEKDPNMPREDQPQNDEMKAQTYVPGDLTDPQHRHSSSNLLRPNKLETLDEERKSDMTEKQRHHSAESIREQSPKVPNPFACVYRNFEMAKKCAKDNLEHHPLPDTVTDAMYRKLQMQGALHPGLALKEEPQTTGVGWKGYGATGPSQCTKLRIYRPKTSAVKKLKNGDGRPGSTGSFDLKWRFIQQKNVKPIDLAICWDMRPENPQDEPRRTRRIDGSNGSAAPAVFTMVHSPKQPQDEAESRKSSISKQSCDGIHGCGSVKISSAGSQRSVKTGDKTPLKVDLLQRPKTSSLLSSVHNDNKLKNVDPNNNLKSKSISTNSLYVNAPLTRKASKETNQTFESVLSVNKTNLNDRSKLHQSSPNLSRISSGDDCHIDCVPKKHHCRPCVACDAKFIPEERSKTEYKMAFKAGKLNGNNSDNGTNSSGSGTRISVKLPKQRDPYAKRNYDINSLHPPFSLWKGTSCQSYPEHWRLASIYQHSYKPLESRKRPLLASVYQ